MAAKRKKVRPKTAGTRGPVREYPIERWLNGEKHMLRFGVDFKANLKSMINYLYKMAKQKNSKIKIINCLEIQALIPKRKGKKRA